MDIPVLKPKVDDCFSSYLPVRRIVEGLFR
jgi:hypothetical protein